MTELERLVRRWQSGWARSRAWNDYTDRDGIIRMKIDQPTRKADYILTDEEPDRAVTVAGLVRADEHAAGLSWLTMVTPDAAKTRVRLEQQDLQVIRSEWLMRCVLAEVQAPADEAAGADRTAETAEAVAGTAEAVAGTADAVAGDAEGVELVRGGTTYWLETDAQPGRIEVRVRAAGRRAIASPDPDGIAASGRMVVLGTDAIADVIVTDPDHQRRGLGRAVMNALTAAAIRQGATDGLLVASQDGLQLYRALGWQTVAEIVIARSR